MAPSITPVAQTAWPQAQAHGAAGHRGTWHRADRKNQRKNRNKNRRADFIFLTTVSGDQSDVRNCRRSCQ